MTRTAKQPAAPRRTAAIALIALLALALAPLTATAQRRDDERGWATVLGRDTLSRADLGVRGTITRLESLAGASVIVVSIEEVLWGQAPARTREISAVRQDRAVAVERGKQIAVFVRRLRTSWEVVGLFFIESSPADEAVAPGEQPRKSEGARRLEALRRHLALERMAPGEEREAAHRQLILEGLTAADSDWAFSVSCGELYKRMIDRRGQLEPAFRRAVSRAAFTQARTSRADQLRELLRLLPPVRAGKRQRREAPAPPPVDNEGRPLTAGEALRQLANAPPDGDLVARARRVRELGRWRGAAEGAAVRAALLRALGSEALAVRRAAAFALGQLADSASTPALIATAGNRDDELARLAIRALGLLRADVGVAAIQRRMTVALRVPRRRRSPATRALLDESLIALARIRSRAAMAVLDAVARQSAEPGLQRLARYGLSDAFARLE